ncbi:MAG: hypothetical protein M1816_002108 [Peltula sp. TS41687]|nr:MAG: hypothetical protein M1816_002108 [Peltula sp. TS41687]
MRRIEPKQRTFSLPELIVRVGAGSPVVSKDYHRYLSAMDVPSVGSDFLNTVSDFASEVPLPVTPAIGVNAGVNAEVGPADVDVDVKLDTVDAQDHADVMPDTDFGAPSLSVLESQAPTVEVAPPIEVAPPAEGDDFPTPTPELPRVPAVTPAAGLFEAQAVPSNADGLVPAIDQNADTETKKQQEGGVADYFSIPSRVNIIPGTPFVDDNGNHQEPTPGLLGAPAQRSDSVSAKDHVAFVGESLAPYPPAAAALLEHIAETASVQPLEALSKDVELSVPTVQALDPAGITSNAAQTVPALDPAGVASNAAQAVPALDPAGVASNAAQAVPALGPAGVASNAAQAVPALDPAGITSDAVPTVPALDSADIASNAAPTVLVVTAADKASLAQQGAPKLQTLLEETDLDHGPVQLPISARDQPDAGSWAEEVLQLVASQQAILVGGPGHTITITNEKDALAEIASGQQPELSGLVPTTTTVQDVSKDLSQEDESSTLAKGKVFLRKVRDAAQSLSRSHSRTAGSKDDHPVVVPAIQAPEVSAVQWQPGKYWEQLPQGATALPGGGYAWLDCNPYRVDPKPVPASDSTAPGNVGESLNSLNAGEAISSAPAALEPPQVPTPPKKWRLYMGTIWNPKPSVVTTEEDPVNLVNNDEYAAEVDKATLVDESELSAKASSGFSVESSSTVDSGAPGKGKLFVRKARNAALRRSVLVAMLGHQLAGPTKDGLEALARGEVWVGPKDV